MSSTIDCKYIDKDFLTNDPATPFSVYTAFMVQRRDRNKLEPDTQKKIMIDNIVSNNITSGIKKFNDLNNTNFSEISFNDISKCKFAPTSYDALNKPILDENGNPVQPPMNRTFLQNAYKYNINPKYDLTKNFNISSLNISPKLIDLVPLDYDIYLHPEYIVLFTFFFIFIIFSIFLVSSILIYRNFSHSSSSQYTPPPQFPQFNQYSSSQYLPQFAQTSQSFTDLHNLYAPTQTPLSL